MTSGHQQYIATLTAYLNEIITYFLPTAVALAATFVMVSSISRWSETIRKSLLLGIYYLITNKHQYISTNTWNILDWLCFAWFVAHGHTTLEPSLIQAATANPDNCVPLEKLVQCLKTTTAVDFVGLLQQPEIQALCRSWEHGSDILVFS
jgi:hypothetical protein